MKLYLTTAMLLLVFSLNAIAGYDKTEWGMSLDKVKKLYPGGLMLPHADELTYGVVRAIGNIETGFVQFEFAKNQLIKVQIIFPDQKTKVDMKTGGFTGMSTEDADKAFASLQTSLKSKYGPIQSVSDNHFKFWVTKSGDPVILTLMKSEGMNILGIVYKKRDWVVEADSTEGL